jgi:hypothetical protein
MVFLDLQNPHIYCGAPPREGARRGDQFEVLGDSPGDACCYTQRQKSLRKNRSAPAVLFWLLTPDF